MAKLKIGRAMRKFYKKNAATIWCVVASAGVVATTVSAVKSGMKTQSKLDKLKSKKKVTKKAIVKAVAKDYVCTVTLGALTIASICTLHKIGKKREAALISALGLMSTKYADYKKAVKETDEEVHIKAEEKVIKKKMPVDEKDIFKTTINEGEQVLAYDSISERYFYTSYEDLLSEIYQINRHFIGFDYLTANEYFTYLGIPETEWGEDIGWDTYGGEAFYGYRWIDILIRKETLSDGLEVYYVDVPFQPAGWSELGYEEF